MSHRIITLRTPKCKSCLIAKIIEKEISDPKRKIVKKKIAKKKPNVSSSAITLFFGV